MDLYACEDSGWRHTSGGGIGTAVGEVVEGVLLEVGDEEGIGGGLDDGVVVLNPVLDILFRLFKAHSIEGGEGGHGLRAGVEIYTLDFASDEGYIVVVGNESGKKGQ
jgi:hypothetical protein